MLFCFSCNNAVGEVDETKLYPFGKDKKREYCKVKCVNCGSVRYIHKDEVGELLGGKKKPEKRFWQFWK